LLVSCFGVIGFTSFTTQRRMKEIAIRKVLGASERSIYVMWIKSLGLGLIISALIAIPFAYYFFNKWTENLVYKEPISIMIIPFAIIVIGLALFGASFYNVFMASTQNAAKVLKQD
jgi:putative ABC transport system permease protein